MESELLSQRDYYLLGVDIYKTLALTKEHRPIPAKEYLDKCYNTYCKLMESSNALAKKLEDKLTPLPIGLSSQTPINSSSSSLSIDIGNTI
jgi:hypothetical protein